MSQSTADEQRPRHEAARPTAADGAPPNRLSTGRETVESFVMVFLFFLVLGLEAEGFVIPTGSMAPTLMGRHKEVTCPQCGLVYAVNADREVGAEGASSSSSGLRVVAGTCVNCRYTCDIKDEPNFQGDRIYVMKTPLSLPLFGGLGTVTPGRWEVAVFKLPEEPEVRYIKRMVGMPGEVVRIHRGDIWLGPLSGDGPFHRALRPLSHQDAMQMLVYDDTKRAKALEGDPRWKRWTSRTTPAWTETEPGTYHAPGGAGSRSELRYRNVVPDPVQWAALAQGQPLSHPPRATLITDFYSYNTDVTGEAGTAPSATMKAWRQPHWVGDLTLHFRLDVPETKGKLRIELVKAGVANEVVLDLERGEIRFPRAGALLGKPVFTGIDRPGTFDVVFSSVDDRLDLRIDGTPRASAILFPTEHGASDAADGEASASKVVPTAADLEPAAVVSEGAGVTVRNLLLQRDIYYTTDPAQSDYDALDLESPLPTDPVALFAWLSDERQFRAFGRLRSRDFPIAPGHYMMLGDNSPWSRDGRAWRRPDQTDPDDPTRGWDSSGRQSWEVPSRLVIGKAFCVYWPHMKPFGPTFHLGRDLVLPARPNVESMRWIR